MIENAGPSTNKGVLKWPPSITQNSAMTPNPLWNARSHTNPGTAFTTAAPTAQKKWKPRQRKRRHPWCANLQQPGITLWSEPATSSQCTNTKATRIVSSSSWVTPTTPVDHQQHHGADLLHDHIHGCRPNNSKDPRTGLRISNWFNRVPKTPPMTFECPQWNLLPAQPKLPQWSILYGHLPGPTILLVRVW